MTLFFALFFLTAWYASLCKLALLPKRWAVGIILLLGGVMYAVSGIVRHGAKLGRSMGFPTVNVIPEKEKLLPPFGVYASRIYVAGRAYYGITNIGKKPTVSVDDTVTIENYIFDFEGDIYGEDIEIQLILFERPEMKFEDINSLKNQIKKDEEFTRDFFLLKGGT